MDLKHATRDELIQMLLTERDLIVRLEQLIARQQADLATQGATITRLTQHIGELTLALAPPDETGSDSGDGPARPTSMPGLKPGAPKLTRPPKPPKRRPHGFARRRMEPTARQVHAVAQCLACRIPLVGGTVVHTREVIEVPVVPVTVTEHVYLARRCPGCRQVWRPPVELAGVVAGQSRLGVRLVSLIATLREAGRLPLAVIQDYLQTLHGLHLSVGGLRQALARVAARGQPLLAEVRAAIRASPVVHADESGWREDGRNGYIWTFSTPTERYFLRRGREKVVVDEVLGAEFAGVLVTDFYAAYDHYPGLKQRCWAHLLRDIRDLCRQHPTDALLQGWATAVRALYQRASAAWPPSGERQQQQRAFERELLAVCQPYLADEAAPHGGLCRRIEKYLSELFVFVADPRVPPTNNEAERSLRPVVTARKISGGTRSPAGSDTKMTLSSLFGTWRVRGLNPFEECCRLLSAPQV